MSGEIYSEQNLADMVSSHGEVSRTPVREALQLLAKEGVEPLERITVRGTGGRIELIGVGDIAYLQAEGDYVAIVTERGRWLKEGTMKWFEEALPSDGFVRVHRSFIVSVSHISRIETSGREHYLYLRGGNVRCGAGSDSVKPPAYTDSIRISDAGYRLLKRALKL